MSNAFTTNLNLTKPEVGADSNAWGGHLNADLDALDAVVTPNGTGTAVGINIAAAVTSTTYTLNMSGVMTGTGSVNMLNMSAVDVKGSTFGIHDATDTTKIVRISVAAITTASTRTISMIDADVTIVGATNTQTLTNKTLTAPIINAPLISSIASATFTGSTSGTTTLLAATTASGTVALPAVATVDILVAATATQTLLNKTISGSVNTITNVSLTTGVTGVLPSANGGFPGTMTTNSLGSNVAINTTTTFVDGPSVAQGTTGTWLVSGTVTVNGVNGSADLRAKLWDGTSVVAATASVVSSNTPTQNSMALTGIIANPAGNLRISVQNASVNTGTFLFNASGTSKDCTITAVRIA